MKKSKKISDFYNKILQSGNKSFRSVAYNTDLYQTFDQACLQKSPVKIAKHRMVPKCFDSNKQDVEINQKTVVCQTTVDFDYGLPGSALPPVPEIKDLQELISESEVDKSMEVSVLVYLDVFNRPCITTASKYHSKPVVKKELRAKGGNKTWGTLFGVGIYIIQTR